MTGEVAMRVNGFLGLCTRAGQLVFGQEACVDAVRKHTAALVLLDSGCSANTRKRFVDACETHKTPLFEIAEGMIAKSVGKEGRMVAAIKHGGMADKLLSLLKDEKILAERRKTASEKSF